MISDSDIQEGSVLPVVKSAAPMDAAPVSDALAVSAKLGEKPANLPVIEAELVLVGNEKTESFQAGFADAQSYSGRVRAIHLSDLFLDHLTGGRW